MPQVRWVCPQCGKGANGSTRPRMDDAVRYCLGCTAKTGKLVLRTAPALEAKRQELATQAKAKAQLAAQQAKARKQAYYQIEVIDAQDQHVTLDVLAFVKKCMQLPEIRGAWLAECRRVRGCEPNWVPDVKVRRSATERYRGACSGRAWWASYVSLTFGIDVPLERAQELILHEVAHTVCHYKEHHGPLFKATLLRAARELWPGLTVKNQGKVYDMDNLIWEEARQINLAKASVTTASEGPS